MFAALEQLFNENTYYETLVLGGLLFLSFVLGLIVWALLFHLPKTRKLQKANELLNKKYDDTLLQYQEMKEQLSVQTLSNNKLLQDNEHLKASQYELKEQYNQQRQELEQLQLDYQTRETTLRNQSEQLAELKSQRSNIIEENKAFEKKAVMAQEQQQKLAVEYDQLVEKSKLYLEQLQTKEQEIQSLQNTLTQAKQSLDSLQEDQAVLQAAEAEELAFYTNQLQLADENLQKAFAQGLHLSTDFVDDEQLLEQALQTAIIPAKEKTGTIDLNEEEEALLRQELLRAEQAMQFQGFYQDIQAETLMEIEDRPLEELLEEYETLLEPIAEEINFPLQNTDELVEDSNNIQQQLDQLNPVEALSPRQATLNQEEENLLQQLLELATMSMNADGFYTAIPREQLLDSTYDLEAQSLAFNPKYSTDLQKAIAAEIGQSIPVYKGVKDSLSSIQGLSPEIEEQLNFFEIYNFEQVSRFNLEFIQKLSAALGLTERSIERNAWVQQAQTKLYEKQSQ